MSTEKRVPERMCAACRQMHPRNELFRMVKTPQGEVVCDDGQKVQGRGAYLCKTETCLQRARKAHSLEKALKCRVDDSYYVALLDKLENQE